MIDNDSIISQCSIFWMRRIPWHELKNIQWKNKRAGPKEAYRPTEIEHIANVVTHLIWIVPSIYATQELWYRSQNPAQYTSALIYGATLVFLFGVSTSFHCVFYCCRDSQLKDLLHRCDRAMIYIFIAGSYFPWLTIHTLPTEGWSPNMKWIVWFLAALGIIYQQAFHEQYKCLETFFYMVMGIFPILPIITEHEISGLMELMIGGCFYLIGLVFFKSDGKIPCAHAIWHLFVVMAAGVHYYAILNHLYADTLPPDEETKDFGQRIDPANA